jgi:hypothetical protein
LLTEETSKTGRKSIYVKRGGDEVDKKRNGAVQWEKEEQIV